MVDGSKISQGPQLLLQVRGWTSWRGRKGGGLPRLLLTGAGQLSSVSSSAAEPSMSIAQHIIVKDVVALWDM